jgi:hypothetical protein
MMAKPAWACFLSAIVLTFICAGIYAFIERADVAKATLSEVAAIVGVDTNTTGNTATTVGTIDRCVSVSLTPPNNTFNIDLFVKDVTDLNFWDGTLSFDKTKIHVNSLVVDGFFLGSNGYPKLDCDHVQGVCQVGNVDMTHAGHTGSGVLGRLELTALSAGTSKLYFTLWEPPFGVSGVTLRDHTEAIIGDLDSDTFFDGLVFNAMVVVGPGATCPTDADKDGFTNVEESVDGSDLLNAASTPEMCDGVDNDLDGLTDEWYDRDPVNDIPDCTDAASDSDDDLTYNPTDTDDDNDGYTDAREAYLGTDSLADCRVNSYHSAWPLDINNDGTITVAGDVLNFRGLISTAYGDGKFRKRLDLNADQLITVAGDVLKFRGRISTSCS